jgi:enamine deaminase RidA (YjgF/YER057c/UK114 family)
MATVTSSFPPRLTEDGVRYSVVELGGVRHVFATAVPSGDTPDDQLEDALLSIAAVMDREGAHDALVQQTVFVDDAVPVERCRRLMRAFHGDALPPTAYLRQPPCEGQRLAVEAWGEAGTRLDRDVEGLVVASHDGVSWIHCTGVGPQTASERVYDRSASAFRALRSLLGRAGVRFEQVLRTWLYLGDIVGREGEVVRYTELNRARADFFDGMVFLADRLGHPEGRGRRDRAVYPASTGIGTRGRDIVLGCVALVTPRPDVWAVPLENPRQTSAYDYTARYSPRSPKFSRGMALVHDGHAALFISGTASITRSETRHPGDPEAQTHEILDNIEALTGEDNLDRHGLPGLRATLDNLARAHVYVKRPEDYPLVRAVCEARLGEVPVLYTVADVCRPDLLVEIEGIAFT